MSYLKAILVSTCAALTLMGCASAPKPPLCTSVVDLNETAFRAGQAQSQLEHCATEVSPAMLSAHKDAVSVLLSSYPKDLKQMALDEYAKGYAAGEPSNMFSGPSCKDLATELLPRLNADYKIASDLMWRQSKAEGPK
jgi:hypothetical protein